MTSGSERLAVEWLGRIGYAEGLERQRAAWQERREGRGRDRLLLLEHPPVVTRGRASRDDTLRVDAAELARRGVGLHDVARGGDVTYHGPGQLVGYLVLDLAARDRDLHAHLRRIEAALMDACADFGVRCKTIAGRTGLFVDAGAPLPRERKLASIGVGVRHWITQHGFGLNVTTDLAGFDVIVPCGLEDVDMTTIARERPTLEPGDLPAKVRERVARACVAHFG